MYAWGGNEYLQCGDLQCDQRDVTTPVPVRGGEGRGGEAHAMHGHSTSRAACGQRQASAARPIATFPECPLPPRGPGRQVVVAIRDAYNSWQEPQCSLWAVWQLFQMRGAGRLNELPAALPPGCNAAPAGCQLLCVLRLATLP